MFKHSEDSAHLINAENNIRSSSRSRKMVIVGSFSELITEDDVTYTVKFDTDGGTVLVMLSLKKIEKINLRSSKRRLRIRGLVYRSS